MNADFQKSLNLFGRHMLNVRYGQKRLIDGHSNLLTDDQRKELLREVQMNTIQAEDEFNRMLSIGIPDWLLSIHIRDNYVDSQFVDDDYVK